MSPMTERECQARLRPHTGRVQVDPDLARARNEALDALIEQAMLRSRKLKIAERTLEAIAEEPTLAGVQAKSTLETIRTVRPAPNLRPVPTHDHAGPDY